MERGCASGEEPYTIALVWRVAVAPSHPGVAIEIVATDADAALIERARRGRYPHASARELPRSLRAAGFDETDDELVIKQDLSRAIDWRVEDLRRAMPDGPFDVVLCRNVAFTYLDEPVQREVGAKIVERLARPPAPGVLVIGQHETLPPGLDLAPLARCVHERVSDGRAA